MLLFDAIKVKNFLNRVKDVFVLMYKMVKVKQLGFDSDFIRLLRALSLKVRNSLIKNNIVKYLIKNTNSPQRTAFNRD